MTDRAAELQNTSLFEDNQIKKHANRRHGLKAKKRHLEENTLLLGGAPPECKGLADRDYLKKQGMQRDIAVFGH